MHVYCDQNLITNDESQKAVFGATAIGTHVMFWKYENTSESSKEAPTTSTSLTKLNEGVINLLRASG
jgi:hypothetical protein